VVLLVPPAPDPPLALQAGRQPADRALLQAEEGRELALGDAVRRQQFGQRAGTAPPGVPPLGALPSGALPSGALPSGALPSGALPLDAGLAGA